jgi:hypothetical protein
MKLGLCIFGVVEVQWCPRCWQQFVQLLAAVGCQMAHEWSSKDHVACIICALYDVIAHYNRIIGL